MILRIAAPAVCVDCAAEIPGKDKKACEFVNGSYLCLACRKREEEKNKPGKAKEEQKCAEVRMNLKQRERAEMNPVAVVEELLHEFLRENRTGRSSCSSASKALKASPPSYRGTRI